MAQYLPHIVLAAGVCLLAVAAMTTAAGMWNGFVFRLIPAIIGALTLAAAMYLYMGAS